jgi:hypothetical protein
MQLVRRGHNLYDAATNLFFQEKNSNGSRTHATCVTWSADFGQEWALHGRVMWLRAPCAPGQSSWQLRALCSRSNRLAVERYACAALVLAYLGATYKKEPELQWLQTYAPPALHVALHATLHAK